MPNFSNNTLYCSGFSLYQEPTRAEGLKERPTTHSSSRTMLSAEPGLVVHQNHVQLGHGCFKFGNVIGQNEGDYFQ